MREKLEGLGIEYQAKSKYYTKCPKCSSHRKKSKEGKSLAVFIEDETIRYKCLHADQCEWNETQVIFNKGREMEKEQIEVISHEFVPIEDKAMLNIADDMITYDYYNEHNELMFVIVRTQDKKFFPMAMTTDGEIVARRPKEKCLYRSNLMHDDGRPVIVVEGEKTANAAAEIFQKADVVTWPGGAANVLQGNWELLNGREVILWPDNDDAGRSAMSKIAGLIKSEKISMVEVSTLEPKADLADDIPTSTIRELYLSRQSVAEPLFKGAIRGGELSSLYTNFVEGFPLGWDTTDKYIRLPERGLCVINGRTNHGKSLLMINMAANLLKKTDAVVLYLSYELSKAETTLRLIKAMEGIQYDPVTHKDDKAYYEAIQEGRCEAAKEIDAYVSSSRLTMTDESVTLEEIEKTFERLHIAGKRAVLFVDYIQLIPSLKAEQARYLEIKNIVEKMRQYALKFGHVIVGGSQLTEGETHRQDAAREGKDITFTAALVLKVWNKISARAQGAVTHKKDPETKENIEVDHYDNVPGTFIIDVQKTRQGQAGKCFGFNIINGNQLKVAAEEYKDF